MSFLSRVMERMNRLPPAQTRDIVVDRDLKVPMRDGVTLLADRFAPRKPSGPLPTILVRSPYGRGGLWGVQYGELFSERGFQVVIQSCRGTFGSGGEFLPFHAEREDGLATLAWLRDQPWFDGRLAMMGGSYVGYVQWAMGADVGPGHKIRVQVSSGAHPRFARNPGSGERFDTTMRLVAAEQTVFHDPERPSAVVLPVLA